MSKITVKDYHDLDDARLHLGRIWAKMNKLKRRGICDNLITAIAYTDAALQKAEKGLDKSARTRYNMNQA